MPVLIHRSPMVDSAVKCLNTLAPMDKPNLLVTQEGKIFKVSIDKDATLEGLKAGSNGILNALHIIRSTKVMSYENSNRVRKFRQDLDVVSNELETRRDQKLEQAASKFGDLRRCFDAAEGVSSLIRLAAQAEKLTKVKGEFIRHLLSWLKTVNEDDIKNTSLESFSGLKRLIAHAKGESLCSSYDELFDKLHLECFQGLCGTSKQEIVDFFGQINTDIKNGEFGVGYILGDFVIQRDIFQKFSKERASPSAVNKWYKETKVNKIKLETLITSNYSYSFCSNFKALKAFLNDLLDKQSVKVIEFCPGTSKLEKGLFNGYKNLERINFYTCKNLKKVPAGLFDGLESLKVVDFSFSAVEEIEPGFVKECPSIESIYFTFCKSLKKLPKGMLKGLESLKVVDFSKSAVEEIEPGFVKECPSIESIYFKFCKSLKKLPKGMLKGLESLKVVNFSKSAVEEIEPGFVKECPLLEKLDFSNCTNIKKVALEESLRRFVYKGSSRIKFETFCLQ